MADYQDIRGLRVKYLSADPADPAAGEVWYNSTTGTLKSRLLTEAWSSAANLNNATAMTYGTGTQTAALVWAGAEGTVNTVLAKTEEYNGSGWTAGGVQSTARKQSGGAGTQTASLMIGGTTGPPSGMVTTVESYDGSSWTASPALNGAKKDCGTFGTSTAAVVEGGATAPQVFETWDNTSWTNGPAPIGPASRFASAGSGTETAGLLAGANDGPGGNDTSLEYNGSAFSAGGTLNTARGYSSAFGIQTSSVLVGGADWPAYKTATETYDGDTWTTSPATLANAAAYGAGLGSSTAGLGAAFYIAGLPATVNTFAEEWNRSASVITAGAWAAGGVLNTGRRYLCGFGTPTTAVAAGGATTAPAITGATEEYDGETWTAVTAMGTARYSLAGCGTLTAGLAIGGGPGYKGETEEYNGTTWAEQSDLNTPRQELSAFGTQTAGVAAGGDTGSVSAATEEYDGSSWTTSPGSMNTARKSLPAGGAGTLTAGITYGGNIPPVTGATETYDGSTWTAGAAMNIARSANFSALQGTTTAALTGAGSTLTNVEAYDGTAWSSRPSLATVRNYAGGVGTQSTAMCFGGRNPGTVGLTATEQFTAETSAAYIETLTTS